MIKIKAIYYPTGEFQEKTLTPETVIQGGGLIGRNPKCDLVLNSPEVSRVHARISYKAGEYYFTDLGSTDGSQVNNEEAKTNQGFLLKRDDIIRIGEFILLIEKVELNSDRTVYQPQSEIVTDVDPPQRHQHQTNPVLNIDPVQIQQLIFKAGELKAQGILKQGTSELVFQDKRLVEVLSLSKRFQQKAIALCQAELDAGKLCLLVEHSDHLTIWQQAADRVLFPQNFQSLHSGS